MVTGSKSDNAYVTFLQDAWQILHMRTFRVQLQYGSAEVCVVVAPSTSTLHAYDSAYCVGLPPPTNHVTHIFRAIGGCAGGFGPSWAICSGSAHMYHDISDTACVASGSLGEQSRSHRHGRGDPSDPTCWYWPSCPLADFRHAFRNDWHHEFTQSSMMIVQMISETDVLHWFHCFTLEWSKKFNGFCEC